MTNYERILVVVGFTVILLLVIALQLLNWGGY